MKKLKLSISLFAFIALLFVNCNHSDVVQPEEKAPDLDQLAIDLAKDEDFMSSKMVGYEISTRYREWFWELPIAQRKDFIKAHSKAGTEEQKMIFRQLFMEDEAFGLLWEKVTLLTYNFYVKFPFLRKLSEKERRIVLEKAEENHEKILKKAARAEYDCEAMYDQCTQQALSWAQPLLMYCFDYTESIRNQATGEEIIVIRNQCVHDVQWAFEGYLEGCGDGWIECENI
jgi:hypothetical protein